MEKDSEQLEMFSLEEKKKGRRKEKNNNKDITRAERNIVISREILTYIILGILVIIIVVYIAGVEAGRRWKVEKIYKEYIQGESQKKNE